MAVFKQVNDQDKGRTFNWKLLHQSINNIKS